MENKKAISCIDYKPHDFKVVQKKWQTISHDFFNGKTVLDHVEEKLVCVRCGETCAPFGK